uniref:Uncharacterized protein n=1 Tax=Triticum urartu TaxID=4572 RepID=A0A8R7TQ39_TRIUA
MVCAPESATRSATSPRPLVAKDSTSVATLAVLGAGRSNTFSCAAGARLSRFPCGTLNQGPPEMTMMSRVASRVMSAQETTGPQTACARARMDSMSCMARGWMVRLGPSAVSRAAVLLRRMEASQPCGKQSWK